MMWRRYRSAKFGLLSLLTMAACAVPARLPSATAPPPVDESFTWSEHRLLEWPDFRGRPDADSDAVAVTSYVLAYQTECLGNQFLFHIESRFMPRRSWVQAGWPAQPASALTLQHERTHFDISEVQVRRAHQALAAIPSPCTLDDEARHALITPFVEDDAGVQQRYDRETAHGTDAARQAEWNTQVRQWLDNLAPAPPRPEQMMAQPQFDAASPVGVPAPPALSPVETVVARAATYVRQYQRALTKVIADEGYEQRVVTQIPQEPGLVRQRITRSEVFFLFAEDWMAMRDVVSLDHTTLEDRPNLRQALATLPTRDVGRRFKEYNSRYNLGRIIRNFNEPTLSLLLLDDRYRPNVSFEWKKVRSDKDGDWVTVEFTERPTEGALIVDLSGAPAPSEGEFEIHAATGRVRLARMTTKIGAVTAELTTTYAPDERLDMLVPVTFVEHYVEGAAFRGRANPLAGLATRFEEIRGHAEYNNYRRFEVKVIIR